MRDTGAARHKSRHDNAAANLHARLGLRRPGNDLFECWAARGEGDELLVPGAALEVAERGRCGAEGVEAQGAGGNEGIAHVRQLAIEEESGAGLQVVGLAELGDAAPFPALPRLAGRFRGAGRIAFQDGDVVAVAPQEHRGGQAAHARAEDCDPGHHHPRTVGGRRPVVSLLRTPAPRSQGAQPSPRRPTIRFDQCRRRASPAVRGRRRSDAAEHQPAAEHRQEHQHHPVERLLLEPVLHAQAQGETPERGEGQQE